MALVLCLLALLWMLVCVLWFWPKPLESIIGLSGFSGMGLLGLRGQGDRSGSGSVGLDRSGSDSVAMVVRSIWFDRSPVKPSLVATVLPIGHVAPPRHTFPVPGLWLTFLEESVEVCVPTNDVVNVVDVWVDEQPWSPAYQQSLHGVVPDVAESEHFPRILVKLAGPPGCVCVLEGLQTLEAAVVPGRQLKPGEMIGTAGRQGQPLMWGLEDHSTEPAVFASERLRQRYGWVVCPLPYCEPGVSEALEERMHGMPPDQTGVWQFPCDVLGTAAGFWYIESHVGNPRYGMVLAPLSLDPDRESMISLGLGTHVRPLLYTLRNENALNWSKVAVGDEVTVKTTTSEIFRVRLLTESTLELCELSRPEQVYVYRREGFEVNVD